ncbi:Gfo/Idh/MocA family oxidoreductase [Candidatus Uhrbacteria bacterium]|nr:Gfo/Idh/MocA family oxidoreductase [Candidatus Uhrbacteria bacterium]
MNVLRIGLIGAGYIGREHARCLRLIAPLFDGKVQVLAIADTNKQAAQFAARQFAIPVATANVDEVIDHPEINVIFSCVPTKFHLDVMQKAVAKGKAVFCEKPFAVSLEDAHRLHDLLTKNQTPHQVGFVLRYAPTYHALKKMLVTHADVSPLRTVILRDDQVFPIQGISHFTDWRSRVELAGAGVLIEHGIHDIDLFEWLFGPIKRVSARMSNFAGYPGIEDYIEIRMEFESGVSANMIHVWHEIGAHQSIRHFEIFFQKALITLDTYDMHHINVRDQEAEKTYERPDLFKLVKDDPLFTDVADREDLLFVSDYYALQDYWFVRNLLEDKPLFPTIQDGLRAFTLAYACYESAKKDGAWVATSSKKPA